MNTLIKEYYIHFAYFRSHIHRLADLSGSVIHPGLISDNKALVDIMQNTFFYDLK